MLKSSIERNKNNFRRVKDKVVEYGVCYVYKYKGWVARYICRFKLEGEADLGYYFGEQIYNNLPQDYDLRSDYDYLLPIPSRPSSHSDRGYDAVRLIGERLSELCDLPLKSDILEALDRPPQKRLSGAARCKNVKDSFRLINPACVAEKRILVLDDVMKSGSTMCEAMRTLSIGAPRQLDALVLAKTLFSSSDKCPSYCRTRLFSLDDVLKSSLTICEAMRTLNTGAP